eukprot:scaffold279245_cov17-Tisochrysis_lutea.AAC.1
MDQWKATAFSKACWDSIPAHLGSLAQIKGCVLVQHSRMLPRQGCTNGRQQHLANRVGMVTPAHLMHSPPFHACAQAQVCSKRKN